MGRALNLAWYWRTGENLSPEFTNWDWPNYGVPLTDWDDGLTDWDWGLYGPERFRALDDDLKLTDSVSVELSGLSVITRAVSDNLVFSDIGIPAESDAAAISDSLLLRDVPMRDIAKRPSEGLLVVDFASLVVNDATIRNSTDKLLIGDSATKSVIGGAGAFDHNSAQILNGTFGAGGTATTIWDNCDQASLAAAGWGGAWPNAAGAPYDMAYSTIYRGITMPHGHTTKYMRGCHAFDTGTYSGYNVMCFKAFTVSLPAYIYISYYIRCDDNWVFGIGSPADDNFKTTDYSIGGEPYNLPNNFYTTYCAPTDINTPEWGQNDDNGTWEFPDAAGHHSVFWDGTTQNPWSGYWTKVEEEWRLTSTTGLGNGFRRLWENGVSKIRYQGATDRYAGTSRNVAIGGYYRGRNVNNWRYYTDLVINFSLARLVLTNNGSSYGAGTIFECQQLTSYNTNQLGYKAKLGKFTAGQTGYLWYVSPGGISGSPAPALQGSVTIGN